MKTIYKILITTFLSIFFLPFIINAQKDTTELKVGNKKLIITDKNTQKENAIYNLEKGKESFEKEIADIKESNIQHQELIQKLEKRLDSLSEITNLSEQTFQFSDSDINMEKKLTDSVKNEILKEINDEKSNKDVKIVVIGKDNESLDKLIKAKLNAILYETELKKLEAEIKKEKLLIGLNQKKEQAFKKGIADIESGIADIKNNVNDYNNDLNSKNGKHFKKEFHTGKINNSGFNAHWAGFEIGLLNFLNAKMALASDKQLDYMVIIPEKTMSYGLNILEFDIPLSKNKRFGAATGAGLEWNSLALKQNITLYEDENGIIRAEYVDPEETDYTKNKFNIVYLTVPLIFEFQIPVKHRKIYIGAGVTGGIRAWSKQKQKYKVNGETYKNKKTDDFQLASFRYGTTARIGYGNIGLFINYSFVPLFKEGAGPEIFPISVGIKVVDF
ncbi:MAG: outer membrane beta-barrel protein [Chlorobi bacterium]|nr:outer membrane beta-barrel protein [Chlorobiota bacterium]